MISKITLRVLVLIVCLMILPGSIVLAQDFCEGDFDYDADVDADDVTTFLENFGREPLFNPCPPDGPAPVAETGQIQCFEYVAPDWVGGDCAGTGQDGEYKKGVEWPNPRFTDHGDLTVTDNLTGLMWMKRADGHFDPALRTWQQALDGVAWLNSVNFHGYSDWRLPNSNELLSLIDRSQINPALPTGHPFTYADSSYYWSSTTLADYPDAAWYVSMGFGYVDVGDKFNDYYVWPVRGGR